MNAKIVWTIFAAAATFAAANPSWSQTLPAPPPRTIRVSGVGEATAKPDLATVNFAVETTGRTAQEAGQQNAALMDRVIRALLAAGVERDDIATSNYSLYPEYADQLRQS